MEGVRLQKIMGITVVLALLTAVAAGLSVLNGRNAVASPTWTMISRFVVVLVFGSFGLAVARESQLQGSVFIGFEDWSLTVRDIVNYGVLPGLVLGRLIDRRKSRLFQLFGELDMVGVGCPRRGIVQQQCAHFAWGGQRTEPPRRYRMLNT